MSTLVFNYGKMTQVLDLGIITTKLILSKENLLRFEQK